MYALSPSFTNEAITKSFIDLKVSYENIHFSLDEIKAIVEEEQAVSIKIKKTMEQTVKSLYSFSQASTNTAIQPSITESIKELQSYLDSSGIWDYICLLCYTACV